jgi:hypothetical protein
LWTKGKKKIDRGARQGPKGGAKSQQSGSGKERDMRTVRFFACGEMGHYAGQCPKKKNKQDGTAATAEEDEFAMQDSVPRRRRRISRMVLQRQQKRMSSQLSLRGSLRGSCCSVDTGEETELRRTY